MPGSTRGAPAGRLGAADFQKLVKSFLLALVGFVVAWIGTELVPFIENLDTTWAMALAAALPFVVNFLRKWLTDTTAAVLLVCLLTVPW